MIAAASPSPSPSPFGQPPPPGASIPELVAGGVLVALGLWSLARWLRTEFDAASTSERLLYAVHVTARVGMWFAFGGFFVGLAVVDEPGRFVWFLLVPLALAGLQLVTAVALRGPAEANRVRGAVRGKGTDVDATSPAPGSMEPEKHGQTADPGHPQPQAAEVESARLLANQAKPALRAQGLSDEQIRSMADEFIALDRGEGLAEFVSWALARRPGGGTGT